MPSHSVCGKTKLSTDSHMNEMEKKRFKNSTAKCSVEPKRFHTRKILFQNDVSFVMLRMWKKIDQIIIQFFLFRRWISSYCHLPSHLLRKSFFFLSPYSSLLWSHIYIYCFVLNATLFRVNLFNLLNHISSITLKTRIAHAEQ